MVCLCLCLCVAGLAGNACSAHNFFWDHAGSIQRGRKPYPTSEGLFWKNMISPEQIAYCLRWVSLKITLGGATEDPREATRQGSWQSKISKKVKLFDFPKTFPTFQKWLEMYDECYIIYHIYIDEITTSGSQFGIKIDGNHSQGKRPNLYWKLS